MSTSWEEGRGAPLDAHPLRCNPVELGVYPKRSAAYQTLSEEDEADRAREIEEGLASARASAAAEIRKIQERKARKFTTVENDKPTNDTVESVADQPKSTAKFKTLAMELLMKSMLTSRPTLPKLPTAIVTSLRLLWPMISWLKLPGYSG